MLNTKFPKIFDRRYAAIYLKHYCRCPKCRSEYTFFVDKYKEHHVKSNRPILLPCGHNMCENCVYHNRNNLSCTVCLSPIAISKDPTKVPNFNVRDYFDMNFFLMGQLNHWRFFCKDGSANNTLFMSAVDRSNLNNTMLNMDAGVSTRSLVKCVECEDCRSVGKCRTCKAYYCKRCFNKIHSISKVLRTHTLQYVDRERNQLSDAKQLTKQVYCKRHQRFCDRYCKKCDAFVCGECAHKDHSSHSYRKLIEMNEEKLEDLRFTLENTQLVRENLNKGQKDIKAVETQFEEYATKTLEEISSHFLQLHNFLQNEEKKIMQKFSEMCQIPQFVMREANIKINESHETLNVIRSTLERYEHNPPGNIYLGHTLLKCNQIIQQLPTNIQISKPQSNPFIFKVKQDIRKDIQNSIEYRYEDPTLLIKIDTSFYESNASVTDMATSNIPLALNMTHHTSVSPKPKGNKKNSKNKKTKNNNNSNISKIQDVAASNISSATTTPNSTTVHLVHVTNIKSPEDFYMQNAYDAEIIRKLSHTYLCNDIANNIPKSISEGRYYMAYHIIDKQWYRGLLKKILPNDVYKIFLVDFGISMEVNKNNLCDIEDKDLKIPFSAIRCAINDIMPAGKKWTEVENNLLLELVRNKPARASFIGKINNDIFKVDLHTDLSKSVRATFLYTGLARERPGIHSFKMQVKPNFAVTNIEERIPKYNICSNEVSAVTVLHIEGPEEFYVIKNELLDSKEELKIELNQYYNNISSKLKQIYLGAVQMCCAVNINEVWYRASIEELKDKGQVIVRLVDEGRTETINWRQAFVLVEEYRNKREFAIPCMLADIEPLQENDYAYTTAAINDFKQMTANPQLRMEVIASLPKMCKVVLYICKKSIDINIGAVLVKQKYGGSTGALTQVVEIVKTPKITKSEQALTIISNDGNPKATTSNIKLLKRSLIKITHLINPGEFYIQLASLIQGTKTFHLQIQEAQAKKCGNKQPLPYETREWYEDNHCLVYTKYRNSQVAQAVEEPLLDDFEWYRGIITKITYLPGEEPTYSVFLRDFGVTICSIYSQQLYTIDAQLDRVTNAVYCCHLACIEPAGGKTWSQSAIDSFIHYISTAETLSVSLHGKRNREQNSLAIVLWSSKIETANPLAPCITKYSNINRNLVRKGLAHMVEPLDTKQQFDQIEEMEVASGEITLEQWFKSVSDNVLLKEIENNEILPTERCGKDDDVNENNELCVDDHPFCKFLSETDITNTTTGQKAPPAWFSSKVITKTIFAGYPTYIDFDCIIYLNEADDKEMLKKIAKKLTETYGPLEPPPLDAHFIIGQACVVKYHVDGKYYRGIITENINSNKEWGVKFVDYGNVENVESKDLRSFAPFPNLPAMASKYIIDGIKPKNGAEKFSTDELDQMHVLLVTKLVSLRVPPIELKKNIKRCSMHIGARNVASDFIERGLAEAAYQSLIFNDVTHMERESLFSSDKVRKSRNPLPSVSLDDYAVFSQGNNMNVDHDNMSVDYDIQLAIGNIDDEDDSSEDDGDSSKYDHIDDMLDRLSKNADVKQLAKPCLKTPIETTTSINATNKPPPKKRMFNDNDYTKMMNVVMVYNNEEAPDFDIDFNDENEEEEDDEDEDVVELGQSLAMNYWHNAVEDMREEENEEISEQLNRRVFSFDDDAESEFEAFFPKDTSTVLSHFSGLESFKIPQLPSAMHHFKCRVVCIITPVILQLFPLHDEFNYKDIDLQRTIKEMVRQYLPPLTNFEPRTLCLACYTKDKRWYRAIIRSYNPAAKTVLVLYVDYLNSETLPLKYVRQCPKELLEWPLRTFRVRLHGLNANPAIKELEIRKSLQKLLNKRELFAVVKKHPICSSLSSGKSLNKPDHIELVLYESKEASLKGITIYDSLIEKNYLQRF